MWIITQEIEWELIGQTVSGAGRHAAIFVIKGVTANTGPGIMATLAPGHTSVSPCRMLQQECTTHTLFRVKETVKKVTTPPHY